MSSSIRPLCESPLATENSGCAVVITTLFSNASWHQVRIAGSLDTPPVRNTSSGVPIFSFTWRRLSQKASMLAWQRPEVLEVTNELQNDVRKVERVVVTSVSVTNRTERNWEEVTIGMLSDEEYLVEEEN